MRTRVKVCGVTKAEQARELVDLGVDAIGVILHANSPRKIELSDAKAIREQVPAFVSLVGVFVDCEIAHLNNYAEQAALDLVQLHGAETLDYTEQLNKPYIKAIRAKSVDQVNQQLTDYPTARAILLDPYVANQHGGTGLELEASLWPKNHSESVQRLILAGGLSTVNVKEAVKRNQPYAIDLNSGVETSPGIKNIDLVKQCLELLKTS